VLLDGADADRMSDASGHPITPFLPRWSGSGSVNAGSSGAAQALRIKIGCLLAIRRYTHVRLIYVPNARTVEL